MRILIALALVFFSTAAQAQRGSNGVSAAIQPEMVEVAKPFRYDVTMSTFGNGELQLKTSPEFGSLEVLARTEFPQFITINNVSQRVLTISWTLRSRDVGTFSIGPPTVRVGDTDMLPEKAAIKVVAAGKVPRAVAQKNDQVYVEATRDPSGAAYVGQQVNLSYAIFNDARIFEPQVRAATDPPLDAFWVESLNDRATGQRQSVPVRGRVMNKTTLRNYAIFPLRTGRAAIDPMGVTLATGGFMSRTREFAVESPALDLDVLPLPPNAPEGFYEGNVGQWNIIALVDSHTGKVGQAINFRLRVTGSGLITRVQLPVLPAVENTRIEPPSEDLQKSTRGNLVVGTKTVQYSIVPTKSGTLVLPPVTLVFFDPLTATYQSRNTAPITLSIGEGVLAPESPAVVPLAQNATSATADEMIAEVLLGLGQPVDETPVASLRGTSDSLAFRLAFAAGLLLLLGALLEAPIRRWKSRRVPIRDQRERLDQGQAALRQASKIDDVAEIIKTTVAAAFFLEPGRTSIATISTALQKHEVDPKIIENFRTTLGVIESARFAPAEEQPDIAILRDRALATLEALREPAMKALGSLIIIVVSSLSAGLVFAATPQEKYDRGDYEAAGLAWAETAGTSDTMAHFNAGVAFARAQKWGPARAHLERAAFLNPSDARIKEELARVKSIVRLQAIESTRVGRVIEGDDALFWWSVSAKLPPWLLPLLSLLTLWIFAGMLVFWRVSGRDVKLQLLGMGAIWVVLSFTWMIWNETLSNTHAVVLLQSTTDFRDGPSELATSRKVRGTTAGTMLHATEVRADWIQVALTNEKDTAWVSSSKVHLIN
jgi:hypothetical protein